MSSSRGPIRELLEEAARGILPSAVELEALGLDEDDREAVRDAAQRIAAIRASGQFGAARAEARAAAFDFGDAPSAPKASADLELDPRRLAAAVRGEGEPREGSPAALAAAIRRLS